MQFLTSIDGKKTNYAAVIAIVYAVSAFLYGSIDANHAAEVVMAALAVFGFRDAVRKIEQKK